MFCFTPDAATLIQSLIRDADLDTSAGLRLTLDHRWRSLAMSLAAHPDTADTVFTTHNARVFADPAATDRLVDTQILDAQPHHPAPAFFLRDR